MKNKLAFKILFILMILCFSENAFSDSFENRVYLLGDVPLYSKSHFALKVFAKNESRFNAMGLKLSKEYGGFLIPFTKWFMWRPYYAYKKIVSSTKSEHLVASDFFFILSAGNFKFSDKNGNEWHVKGGFYRYRNALCINFSLSKSTSFWISEELRFDSDQKRLNMTDTWVGINQKWKNIVFGLFYGFETTRRNKPSWLNTHIFGVVLNFKK